MDKLKSNQFPLDWKPYKLSELGNPFNGLTGKTKEDFGEGKPFIPYLNIFKNAIINSDAFDYVRVNGEENQNKVISGDLFFTTSSETPEEVGMASAYLGNNEELYLNSFCFGFRLYDFELVTPAYLSYYFRSSFGRRFMTRLAQGATRYNLSKKLFLKEEILLPPIVEQQKIAEILSTWDQAIFTTQKLIDELKLRNKGLAQQLLTGKKRLKGFEGEWKERRADKIFKNHTDKSHNGQFEILSATQERGVIPRSLNNIDIKFDQLSLGNYKKVEVGNYVISLRSFQGGIEYSDYEGIVSPAYTVLKEVIPISKTFYKIYFKTETFISRLNTIIYGIRDGKQINYKDFSTLKLPHPPVKEQKAISEILKQADQELKLYQKQIDTLKEQKKGLMQKLLTGAIRVNTE